jgi:Bax protein
LTQDRAASVQATLADVRGLDLDQVRAGVQLVPQARVDDLPARLREIDRATKRKRLFVKTMLPAVLRANAEVRAQRDFLKALIALDIPRGDLPGEMRRKLRALADRYQVDPGNLPKLKRRVDVVPPALVLAQAAIETGWGTSRFAQQGNAIFGQHTRDPNDPGMVPQGLEDPDFRVRSFDTVTQAVQAYLHNLNTHPAYRKLRVIRADARARGVDPDSHAMAAGLTEYSARGWAYVKDIRVTIRANDLQAFAKARLRPSVNQLVDARSFIGE